MGFGISFSSSVHEQAGLIQFWALTIPRHDFQFFPDTADFRGNRD